MTTTSPEIRTYDLPGPLDGLGNWSRGAIAAALESFAETYPIEADAERMRDLAELVCKRRVYLGAHDH
ncbi:hypothetical protein AADG42_05630 [Ammonicoccus fulvus]|uniref:Uncharacterized protein n=1 Tax=Ammonicoccus fulvus TaxID=3138240 RepID=A0ABZ3FPM5_9ACTN